MTNYNVHVPMDGYTAQINIEADDHLVDDNRGYLHLYRSDDEVAGFSQWLYFARVQ